MDLLGDCLPMGLDAQVTVKGLVAFLVNLLLMTVCWQGALKERYRVCFCGVFSSTVFVQFCAACSRAQELFLWQLQKSCLKPWCWQVSVPLAVG